MLLETEVLGTLFVSNVFCLAVLPTAEHPQAREHWLNGAELPRFHLIGDFAKGTVQPVRAPLAVVLGAGISENIQGPS